MIVRNACIAALAGLVASLCPAAALGQGTTEDARVTLAILRECARIADIPARVACYDRNVGVDVALAESPAPPVGFGANQLPVPAKPARDAAPQPSRQFGANQLPAPPRPADQRVDRISAAVTAATQRAPGIWLLTLADGTQWQLVDAAPASYEPPRKGSEIEIAAASLGSYILRYRGQTGLRVRRVS